MPCSLLVWAAFLFGLSPGSLIKMKIPLGLVNIEESTRALNGLPGHHQPARFVCRGENSQQLDLAGRLCRTLYNSLNGLETPEHTDKDGFLPFKRLANTNNSSGEAKYDHLT